MQVVHDVGKQDIITDDQHLLNISLAFNELIERFYFLILFDYRTVILVFFDIVYNGSSRMAQLLQN